MTCGKCRVRSATHRCGEKPHDRCETCWQMWFDAGTRRRPGQWGDRALVKRLRRLARATAAKLRERGLRSATRKNRADRRASQREKLVRVAEDRGLAPTQGEPTKALKNRLRERFSLPKMKG